MIRKALYVARLGKPTVHRELIDGKATDYLMEFSFLQPEGDSFQVRM